MGSACTGQPMYVVPFTPSQGETTDTTRDTSYAWSFYGSNKPDAVAFLPSSQGETPRDAATSLSQQKGETTPLARLKEETSSQELDSDVVPSTERPEDVLTKAQKAEDDYINSVMDLVDEVDLPPPPSSNEATITTSPSRLHEEAFADTVYSTNDEHK